MEVCEGLLAFCTNHVETLDPAVLRRLDLKVSFRRLPAATAREVFVAACAALSVDADVAQRVALRMPLEAGEFELGDFAVALRQAWLRGISDAAGLRECLEVERRARDEQRGRGIGFGAEISA